MAATGKGDFPFKTSWVRGTRGTRGTTLRKQIFYKDTDHAITTVISDWFFGSGGVTYYGILKRWTGATWIKEPLKYWNGATWATKPLKVWDGDTWQLIDTTGI